MMALTSTTDKKSVFNNYDLDGKLLDEVFTNGGGVKKHYQKVLNQFAKYSLADFKQLNEYAKISFFNQGVTFAVYSDNQRGVERKNLKKALFSGISPSTFF
jgi:uncharacterized circularly permuted ATP-grasp superfamily protein